MSRYEQLEEIPSHKVMKCNCGERYYARLADLKRGWGYACSKSCALSIRGKKHLKAKPVDGVKVSTTKPKPSSYRQEKELEFSNCIHPMEEDAFNSWSMK